MNIKDYTVEDFVLDESFRDWVLYSRSSHSPSWQEILDQNPQKKQEAYLAKQLILNISVPGDRLKSHEKSKLLTRIKADLHDDLTAKSESKIIPINPRSNKSTVYQHPSDRHAFWPLFRVAMVLVFALGMGILYYYISHSGIPERGYSSQMMTYTTAKGVKSSISLSDGTKVSLNSGSELIYPEEFSDTLREVILKGEAFFEVEKDADRPFLVVLGGVTAEVLGTSFNVKADLDKEAVISLVSGKIKVMAKEAENLNAYLEPGEGITVDLNNSRVIKAPFDQEKVLAWLNKTIIFDQTELPEVIRVLENWYGVEISLNPDRHQNTKFSGKFKNETLKNILDGLSYGSRFTYTLDGKHVEINFEK